MDNALSFSAADIADLEPAGVAYLLNSLSAANARLRQEKNELETQHRLLQKAEILVALGCAEWDLVHDRWFFSPG